MSKQALDAVLICGGVIVGYWSVFLVWLWRNR